MKRETLIWTLIFLLGAAGLIVRGKMTGMGSSYVRAVEVRKKSAKTGQGIVWTRHVEAQPKDRSQPGVVRSWPRTIGVWVAAFLTFCALSFLYGDNAFFKIAQSLVIGVSAGYAAMIGFWTTIVPLLMGNLIPGMIKAWAVPGLDKTQSDWIYLAPLALSVTMLWRLSPVGGWISRWPLAFFIGITAGTNLVRFFKADFVDQISNTMLPLFVMKDGVFDFGASLKNVTIFLAVLSSLVYFFFSLEHKGVAGKVARVGIGVLMITFGASFGLTVMSRITILSSRLEFLFDDWLWLIDPLGNRLGM